jgi:hypothetical protein
MLPNTSESDGVLRGCRHPDSVNGEFSRGSDDAVIVGLLRPTLILVANNLQLQNWPMKVALSREVIESRNNLPDRGLLSAG